MALAALLSAFTRHKQRCIRAVHFPVDLLIFLWLMYMSQLVRTRNSPYFAKGASR